MPGPRSGDSFSLSFADWPEDDRERWHRGLAAPNPACSRLEYYTERRRHLARDRSGTDAGTGDRRPWAKAPYQWSAATVRSARYAYGSFIKAMFDLGRDRTVTPGAVAIWVEQMLARMSLRSVANRTRDLWYAMRVLHPQKDWRWLWEDAETLGEEAGPVRSKLSRICDIRDIRRAAIARMRRAEAKPKTTATALEFQDGFVMLLLCYRPVRRRNLAETRLAINLVFDQAFRAGRLLYENTKSGNRYEAVLPEKMLPWLRRLIEVYRPILAGPGVTDEAWLSREGGPLSACQLQRRIFRATREELGKPISLHLFRDCLATTVSEIAPERIEDAARILGHRQARGSGRKSRPQLPAIEFYRQVSATTLAGQKLAALQEPYRVHRRQGKRRANGPVVKLSS
jgi:integrase/recombinase XerC